MVKKSGQQIINDVNEAVAKGDDLKKYDSHMNKKDVGQATHAISGFRRDGVNFFSPDSYDRDIEYVEVKITPLYIKGSAKWSTKCNDTRITYHLEKKKLDIFLNNYYGNTKDSS